MKLAKLQEEYVPTKPILSCLCEKQTCSGKYLKIKHWQNWCQWECLRLGFASRMDLKHNIFINMKLTLTIQEIEEPTTKELYKGVFGTLTLQAHRDKFEEDLLEWAEKDKFYQEALEKDDETPEFAPEKPTLESINFAVNVKSIPGLDEIVNQLVADAVNLDKKDKLEKMKARREEIKSQNQEEETLTQEEKPNEIQN